MSQLANQLVIAEHAEVSRGIRQLLLTPLLSERSAPEQFDLVRRRHEPIRLWFDYFCGWQLTVEPRLGYARLVKIRASTDPTRPATRLRSGRAPFDRRRYVLLCLVAAELLAVPVTTIGLLADRIVQATAADEVVRPFDTASRAERMAFVDVLRTLESYGALEVVDGSTEAYVESTGAKVLYRVDATLLLRLLAAPVGPSRLALPISEVPLRFEELLTSLTRERRYGASADPAAAVVSDVQRNLWLRHSVFRRIVDDPVVYFDDLSDAERGYLTSPTGRQLLRRAADHGGFVLEERAEGVLFVDPDGVATDTRFPDEGNAKVAALLLLESLDGPTTSEQLRVAAGRLLDRFPRWAKGYRGTDGAGALAADAVDVLVRFDLARVAGGMVTPQPAAARYAVRDTRVADFEGTDL
jgi:uncharacterized protein (TIGR02678 family)